jgi:hypothetical protein
MTVKQVNRYGSPAYPTRLEVLAQPELLRRHVPPGWRKCAEVALAGAALLAASGVGLAGEKAGPPGKAAIVAPLFEHGEGRGVTGCVVHNPPVFLSEEEALQVIKEELAKTGVRLAEPGGDLPGVAIPRRMVHYKKVDDRHVSEVVEQKDKAKPVSLDAQDPERKVAVEFVSRQDYHDLGGPFSPSTVEEYDFKKVARELGERASASPRPIRLGVFYDPATVHDLQKMYGDDKELQALNEKRRLDKSPELQRLINERAVQIGRQWHDKAAAESRALLRQQVKDFADWLKAQGAI